MTDLRRLVRHGGDRAHHVALRRAGERVPLLADLSGTDPDLLRAVLLLAAAAIEPVTAHLRRRATRAAVHCVRARVPLTSLVEASRIFVESLLAEVWTRCPPGHADAAQRLTLRILGIHRRVGAVFAEVYHPGNRRRAIVDHRARALDLLAGRLPAGRREAPGGYLVASVGLVGAGAGPQVVERLTAVVDQGAAYARHEPSGNYVVVVLPLADGTAAARRGAEQSVVGLVSEIGGLIVGRTAGCAHARRVEEIPSALLEAERARKPRSGRYLGPIRRSGELLLALAYEDDQDLVAQLRARLAPLRAEPQLLRTLVVLFDNDLDRGRTAAVLHIHRGTLTDRLKRINEFTGVAPTSVLGIRLLSAALHLDRTLGVPGGRGR
ncbi:helix-turn-helix domain-containing protein [Micromonospora sp. NPDC050980]|uniref:PucR family transcriptional regulator n=1 Tax=Micromonospora sp. NPDC050980 TaxID=3155161 RepID=UPI0033F551B9